MLSLEARQRTHTFYKVKLEQQQNQDFKNTSKSSKHKDKQSEDIERRRGDMIEDKKTSTAFTNVNSDQYPAAAADPITTHYIDFCVTRSTYNSDRTEFWRLEGRVNTTLVKV